MKLFVKAVLFVAAVAAVLLNIGPLITSGEINPGMIAGFLFAAVCAGYALFFDKINGLVAAIWKSAPGKALIALLVCVAAAAAGVFCVTFFNVVSHGRQSDHKTEYLIVLGCQVDGTRPGIYLTGRLEKALEYLNANPDSAAILSGGQGANEGISEGQCMFDYLTERGIEKSRLTIEDRSTSTYENLRNSVNALRDSGKNIDEITIVTNDFHEYRAGKLAEKCGLKAYSYPSRTPLVGYMPFAVREVFGVILQIYLGKCL